MSESPEPYNNQPRHNPSLHSQVVRLARLLAAQPNADLFALFCDVYHTARGESPAIRDRLLRLVELIAEHPDRAALWARMNSDYQAAVPQRGELWPEIEEAYRIKATEMRLE